MLLALPPAAPPPADAPALRVACPPASGPAVLVDISGWRDRRGQVRVRVFGGAPSTWFDKRHWLQRIEVPVPATGRVSFCVPLPRAGTYAVDVRHDGNGNGDTDRSDGGGASGNPQVSIWDALFGRKPNPATTRVQVGNGPVTVPITLMYLQGGTFRPLR